jgi:uncharacterized membrane protein YraQ (UPF0718 family)
MKRIEYTLIAATIIALISIAIGRTLVQGAGGNALWQMLMVAGGIAVMGQTAQLYLLSRKFKTARIK